MNFSEFLLFFNILVGFYASLVFAVDIFSLSALLEVFDGLLS